MKILYAIQGTGNGHISRARDIIPILQKKGELDILISGTQADVDLPYPIKYRFKGLSFIFGKKGGIDLFATYQKSHLKQLYQEIKSLPVNHYDLVINDFEPVSAWACKMNHQTCIGLSHQSAVISKKSPKSKKKDPIGKAVLQHYAPVTASFGFHFESYDKNIVTPVIREQIRKAQSSKKEHYTVYLPAYSNERIIKVLSEIHEVQWEVFSKHTNKVIQLKNILIRPINNEQFIESLLHCKGVLCGAGFETPAEALFLKKKLMVIPMKGQYEQQCNAAALEKMGVPVIKNLKAKRIPAIQSWVDATQSIKVQYPNQTEELIDQLFESFKTLKTNQVVQLGEGIASLKKLKQKLFGSILHQIAD